MSRELTQRLPRPQGAIDVAYMNRLVLAIEQALTRIASAAGRPYTTANVTATRSLDPTTATLATTAQVLATLITDLQAGGHIG